MRIAGTLDGLWDLMRTHSWEEAAGKFCEKHDCVRGAERAGWKFILPAPVGGVALELGAGFGADTVELARTARSVVSIVPNLLNARILREYVRGKGLANVAIGVMDDIASLPLAGGSVAAIVMEDAGSTGLGEHRRDPEAIAAEWRRVLAPAGRVLLGIRNPLDRPMGLRFLRSIARVRRSRESMNRRVKQADGGAVAAGSWFWRMIPRMKRCGFAVRALYAPLPDECDAQVMVPADDARVLRYFLDNQIRRNSWMARAAIAAAHLLVSLNAFRWVVPYHFAVLERGGGMSEKR